MRRHPTTNQIAHGIAGDGVYVDGKQIAPGSGQSGMPDWMGDQVLYCTDAGLVAVQPDGTTPTQIAAPSRFVRASAHGWAGWSDTRGVLTSWGLSLPGAMVLDMAPDGTLLVGEHYQPESPEFNNGLGLAAYRPGNTTPLWRLKKARPAFYYPYPQASILDEQTACWTENQGGRMVLRAYVAGTVSDGPRPPWNVLHARLFKVNGELWVVYLRSEDDRTIAHPWDYHGLGFSVPGFGYGPEAWQDGALLTLCWSVGQGERATDIKDKTFNLAALETIPPLPAPPPPPPPNGPLGPPEPDGTWVNVAEFFERDDRCWPRGDKAKGDTHGLDYQAVTVGGEPCLWECKFDKDSFVVYPPGREHIKGALGELLSIDLGPDGQPDPNGCIHWRADLSNGGDLGGRNEDGTVRPPSEAFVDLPSDTRWLRNRMQVGRAYALDVGDHTLRKVRRSDGTLIRSVDFNREMWLESYWKRYWINPWGECEVLFYIYNNTGFRDGHGTGDPRLWVEGYFHARQRQSDGSWLVIAWGDWVTYPSSVVFATSHAVFPPLTPPPNGRSSFWHLGGQRFAPDLPTFPMPASTGVSTVTVPDYSADVRALFATDAFNLETHDGCGIFTDAVASLLKSKDANFGHLIKRPGQNQYDGHAVDAVLYKSDVPGQSVAVDIVRSSAEPGAAPDWGLDIPRYSPSDWRDPGPQPASKVQRPALPALRGMSAFDWCTHRDPAWLALHQQYTLPTLRLVPQSVFRTPRTLAEGLAQLDAALPVIAQAGLSALVCLNCDTKEYGMDRDAVRANTAAMNAILVKHFPAMPGRLFAELGNENQNGNEQIWMTDPHFLLELDGLVDARIPLAWGTCFGVDIAPAVTGGSWIAHHSDRGRAPADNGVTMVDAQARYGKPVVDREHIGAAEPGTPGQRYFDPAIARALGVAARPLGGVFLHSQAGLRASVAEFGPTHRACAAALVEGLGGSVPPPPPPPSSILDADMTNDTVWYPIFVLRSGELEAAIAKEYQDATGRVPALSDVKHNLWRACIERKWWITLRRAMAAYRS